MLSQLHLTVVVAVIAVRMVQVSVYQVVGVIAVRNSRVAAIRPVLMGFLVTATAMVWRASGRVCRVDGQGMFLDLAAILVMQMAVMQVIDVSLVQDAGMPAIRAVPVRVAFVMSCHVNHPSPV